MGAYRSLFLFFFFLLPFFCSLRGRVVLSLSLPNNEVATLRQIREKLQIPQTLWNFSVDPCQWVQIDEDPYSHNVTCGDFNVTTGNGTVNITSRHVVSITITGANLTGVLPEELANLTFLSHFDVSRNFINGSIPVSWTTLPLKELILAGNRVTGTIPAEIGSMKALEYLFVESNLLEGPVPPSLGRVATLNRILISGNSFSGELPATLGNLTTLRDFRIDGTAISGKIPSFFGNWTSLDRLDMQGTLMEGPFPPEFSLLQNVTQLRVSDLKNPDGRFPPLQNMLKMRNLVLRNCSISGRIPAFIGQFAPLISLDLSFNNFSGEIPESFGNLGKMNIMFLTNNSLTGSVPDWIKRSKKNMSSPTPWITLLHFISQICL